MTVSRSGPTTKRVSTATASIAYAVRRSDPSGTIVDQATRMAGEMGGKLRPTAAAVTIRTESAAPFTASTAIAARKAAEKQDVSATTRDCPTRSITLPHRGRLIAVHHAKAAVTMPALA